LNNRLIPVRSACSENNYRADPVPPEVARQDCPASITDRRIDIDAGRRWPSRPSPFSVAAKTAKMLEAANRTPLG
jgi:hypothetical protein